MKLAYLDFEFNGTAERDLDLVSVAVLGVEGTETKFVRRYWLYESHMEKRNAKLFFRRMKQDGYVFVTYTEAAARSLLSLFPAENFLEGLKFIDLYLEYRCLLNHNHQFAYGEQYINGEVIKTEPLPPKWERTEEDNDNHHKPSYSLAAASFKMLGIKMDTEEKNTVRDIIIKGDAKEIKANRERIQNYNESDIKYMPALLFAIRREFLNAGFSKEDYLRAAFLRGDYSARTARMVQLGYPVNMDKLSRFMSNVKNILDSSAVSCLEIEDSGVVAFRYCKKQQKYIANEKNIREWIEAQKFPNWRKTEKKKLSLSKDAFNDYFDSNSEGFGGAYYRHLKTKQSLNGFMPGSKTNFLDFVGKDNRVRPFFGIYGAQSSRSQPTASSFIPLKAHWMRNFIEANAGRAICGVDYASQEFLIAAILSQDKAMMKAYASGDVYLAFAKEANLVPSTATKESHKRVRDIVKALVLGVSYDMGAKGLSRRMSQAAGSEVTEDDAQRLIDKFYDTYADYADWKEEFIENYKDDEMYIFPDGWVMWGDNDNFRSVGNVPVQGHGALVMRRAVKNAQDVGLNVIYTLHDALYIEFPSTDLKCIQQLKECMQKAFFTVMSRYGECPPINLEGECWSKDFVNNMPKPMAGIIFLEEYIDAKGERDLNRYRKFINGPQVKPTEKEESHHGIQKNRRKTKLHQVRGMQTESSPIA